MVNFLGQIFHSDNAVFINTILGNSAFICQVCRCLHSLGRHPIVVFVVYMRDLLITYDVKGGKFGLQGYVAAKIEHIDCYQAFSGLISVQTNDTD